MSERYKKYSRKKFKEWKNRVSHYLPSLAIAFYKAKIGGLYMPYEKEKLLGQVIADINNPFYSLLDTWGERKDYENEMAAEIMLQLQVNELFAFINTKCKNSLTLT